MPKEPRNWLTEQRNSNDKGIKKLDEAVNDDLQDVLDRLDALRSDDNAYTSYAGKSDKMDGNVKFVIETEAIDND